MNSLYFKMVIIRHILNCMDIVCKRTCLPMTKEELYKILGHQDIHRDLDVKTLALDLIREKFTPEDILNILLEHLADLDEEFVRGYLYRKA